MVFQGKFDDLAGVARYLVSLALSFEVRQPLELREEMLRLAARIARSAGHVL